MKNIFKVIFLIVAIFSGQKTFAISTTTITLTPSIVIQGEPVMVTINGAKLSDIKSTTYDKKALTFFLYKNIPTAFIGVDINKKIGKYEISVLLNNGEQIKNILTVNLRPKEEAVMTVPDKLGGNSPSNQTKVVLQMNKESQILASLYTGKKSFWTEKFQYPLLNPIITDPYGYSRLTGAYTITHKGVDLRATLGTKVMAANRGVVRLAKNFQVYGKTIVVDHGLGIMTFYMHLSKIKVNVGELVLPGQVIGLSGDTGYAESPHLHLTVRINNASIDPIKFMDFFR